MSISPPNMNHSHLLQHNGYCTLVKDCSVYVRRRCFSRRTKYNSPSTYGEAGNPSLKLCRGVVEATAEGREWAISVLKRMQILEKRELGTETAPMCEVLTMSYDAWTEKQPVEIIMAYVGTKFQL
ncbi:hypothetical protein J3458_004220 [Metarhizium acridum]|uniref:uncharacterized protein n=1 Tax=Metarhizium acridum TaxID=92637 RepID=UPI001C6B3AAF|nr:hypothetical protein J3458_004220 [Metarhizium acridum]